MTGDVLKCLAKLPDESVQCVCTSPPYWGLRDYGTAAWKGGDPGCDHKSGRTVLAATTVTDGMPHLGSEGIQRDLCGKCRARRVDAQIGLEPTPEAYVARMVAVFGEIKRVLRPDGTCWVNLGDSYASTKEGNTNGLGTSSSLGASKGQGSRLAAERWGEMTSDANKNRRSSVPTGLKPKDLVGIPWRVAFALQADGWYLRADIIWAKPNPMPESVRDRPTSA